MNNEEKFQLCLTYDDVNIIPKYSDVESRSECDTSSRLTKKYTLKTPLVAAPMDTVCGKEMAQRMWELGGIGIVHRFQTIEEQISCFPLSKSCPIAAAAVGVRGDYLERSQELVRRGFSILLLDVANGHHINVKRALEKIKSSFPDEINVIVGNIATAEAAEDLCAWGADALRVGLGNGSLCETRIRTAIGIPQVTALLNCSKVSKKYNVPIIADGGIRYVGDVSKALACGAESVMLGSLFAGTRESPGEIKRTGTWPNEQLFKSYRGAASLEAKRDNGQNEKNIEGNSKIIPYKGKVERIINDILDGLRSSMSYVGSRNLSEFRNKAEFVQVTSAGQIEARPHLLENK